MYSSSIKRKMRIPALLLSVIAVFAALLALFGVFWPSALLWGAYALADLAMTIMAVVGCGERNILFCLLPLIFLLLHLCYGVGTVVGVVHMLLLKIRR